MHLPSRSLKHIGAPSLIILTLIAASLLLDASSKSWASATLAAKTPEYQHLVTLQVPPNAPPQTLSSFIQHQFSDEPPHEIRLILSNTSRFDGKKISPSTTVSPGDILLLAHHTHTVIPGIFVLRYQRNLGAAFGLFRDHNASDQRHTRDNWPLQRLLTLAVTVVVVAFVTAVTLWLTANSRRTARFAAITGVGLFAGGAFANAYDRYYTGFVVDFIHPIFWDPLPAFNLADLFLTLGFLSALFGSYIAMRDPPPLPSHTSVSPSPLPP